MYFTPNVSNVTGDENKQVYPEDDPLFCTKGDVRCIGNSVMIKKTPDTVYIRASKVLKCPVKALFVVAMVQALLPVSKEGEYMYDGITEPTTYQNSNSLYFWDSIHTFKILSLKERAFIADYKSG